MSAAATAPTSDIDPFDDAFLSDPFPFHETLRETGAVVRLDRYGIWATGRHGETTKAFQDWETFHRQPASASTIFDATRPGGRRA